MLERFFVSLLLRLPEEISHSIAIFLLKYNLVPTKKKVIKSITKIKFLNFKLTHPVGLAAGFDKNAEALPGLLKQNFSFIEIGTVTPLPQIGNSKPRVFRVPEEKSIINRLGFPNLGASKIFKNLCKIRKYHTLGLEPLIGVNIGCNKNTKNPLKDYEKCFEIFCSVADYITINVSSPNTPGLRKLQLQNNLAPLLKTLSNKREEYFKKNKRKIPLVLKIAPDLVDSDLKSIVKLIKNYHDVEKLGEEKKVKLLEKYEDYTKIKKINISLEEIKKIDISQIVKFIAMISPFRDEDKQVLLETSNLNEFYNKLLSIIEIELVGELTNKTIN